MTAPAWIAAVAAVISLVSVVVAVISARNAARQTALAERATELQRQALEAAAQPYVWVDLRPDESHAQLMRLVAVNQGPTVATDVVIAFDPPLPADAHSGQPAGPAGPLASMPPGRTISWTVGNGGIWTLLGVSRQRLSKLRERPDFPDPIGTLAQGAVWDLDAVEAWHGAGSRTSRAGRPKAADTARTLGGRFVLEEKIGRGASPTSTAPPTTSRAGSWSR